MVRCVLALGPGAWIVCTQKSRELLCERDVSYTSVIRFCRIYPDPECHTHSRVYLVAAFAECPMLAAPSPDCLIEME